MRSLIPASLTYFAVVFLAGFLLGIVRVLWLVPMAGEQTAELIELPVMVAVSWVTAGFVINRFLIPDITIACVLGGTALALLLLVEFTVVLGLRDLTIGAYLESRDTVAGIAYAISLLLYAAFPAIRQLLAATNRRK